MLPYFDSATVHDRLPYPRLADALHEAFAQGVRAPVRHQHTVPGPGGAEGTLLLMPAWWPGRETGVKLVHVCPGNERLGVPTVQAVYLLFDGPTGTPRAVLDGTALTLRRTAAASALAARFLARPESRVLTVIGAGALAPHLARAHACNRPLERILIWNRTAEKAARLAKQLRALGLPAEPASCRRTAVEAADIVTCATTSTTPLVPGSWVRPGTHVDLVGAFRPDMRESDGELVARARVFVDTREGALEEAGDLLQAIAEGFCSAQHIRGDLYDLCAGAVKGRTGDDEITLFKSVGSAVEDLVAAALVVAQGN